MEVAYFDFDDYENPIKTYLLDDTFMYLNPGVLTHLDTKLQVNEAYMSDNRIYGGPYDIQEFYGISQKFVKIVNQNLGLNPDTIAAITIVNDPQTIRYERQVYSIFEMFGFLGGLYDFLLFIGFWITHTFQDKIFHNSIFSDLYQVKTKRKSEDPDTLNDTKYNISKDKVQISFIADSKMTRRCHILTSNTRSITLANEDAKCVPDNNELIENLKDELQNRRAYNFKCHNMLPLSK